MPAFVAAAAEKPLLLAALNEPLLSSYGALDARADNRNLALNSRERERMGTRFGAVANLLNNAIGSGVLVFPFAFGQTGLLFGIVLSSLFAMAMLFTFHVVGTVQEAVGAATYQQLMRRVLGKRGEQCSLLVQIVFLLGTCVSYLDIVADQINAAFPAQSNSIPFRAAVILTIGIVCLPLMFIRTIQKLKFMSTVSLVSIAYTLIVVVVRTALQVHAKGLPSFVTGEPKPGEISNLRYSVDIFRSFPVFAFSFMLHPTYCLVFDEMKERSTKVMDRATMISVTICLVIYTSFGVFGSVYCALQVSDSTFVPGDILSAFPSYLPDVAVARFGMAISVVSSYVGLHFGARTCIQDLVMPQGVTFSKWQFALESCVFLMITISLAILLPGVQVVVDFTAGSCIVALVFCFPGAMLVALAAREEPMQFQAKGMGYAMIVFGVCIGSTSVAVTAVDLFKGT